MTLSTQQGPRDEAYQSSRSWTFSAETAPEYPQASYYRARYYDPTIGRFISEDPLGFSSGGENFYVYTENNSIGFKDPLGLYTLQPHVPAPSAALDTFLKCMDGLVGGAGVTVSATTNGVHADHGHALGTSVDIKPPAGLPADTVFCYGGKCGAARGLNESPAQGGQKLPTTTGDNYHFSLVQLLKHPTTPSAIPDKPECKPGSCSASK
jgi:RHS repeat-associated protein